jgi:hypothetical protein
MKTNSFALMLAGSLALAMSVVAIERGVAAQAPPAISGPPSTIR